MTLRQFFTENNTAAIAFSGGVDSSYLLYAAIEAGARVKAYYLHTQFQPDFELGDASRLVSELGADMEIVEYDILKAPGVAENPPDRCCLCKRAMFTALRDRAAADGYTLLLDGTNATDREEERPGMIALRELGVRSPLRECGLGKEEIRALSKQAGLFTWDKPAYSCLATRIKTGERIEGEGLERVERAESELYSLGFSDLRVRVERDTAKLQFTAPQQERAFAMRAEILSRLGGMFDAVTLDMAARQPTKPAEGSGRTI